MSVEDLYDILNKINDLPYIQYNNLRLYLLNVKSIFNYLECNLSTEELKKIQELVKTFNNYYEIVNQNWSQYYKEIENLFEEEKIQINFRYISIFKDFYNRMIKFKTEFISILNNIKITYKSLLKNKIYVKKESPEFWFENLVQLYLKYGGVLPISSKLFWKDIKDKWDTIEVKHDQQFIIYICEDILGGIDLDKISNNFETWIRRNITNYQILNDFYIL